MTTGDLPEKKDEIMISSKNGYYVGKIVEEGDDMFLAFSPQLLEELGWEEGDNIEWEITDSAVIARKVSGDRQ